MKVWLGDGLVDEERAVVSVFDHGLTVGDGVFETVKVVGGRRPFRRPGEGTATPRQLPRVRATGSSVTSGRRTPPLA